ncbi:NAD(P)-binding domain-containing protein [Streptomyces sp. NPDC047525]|uniref:NAD(P)-binding domain-containing protein n=1 Tax=Streptomyces sp. NPDC047525 TaxID=3155264 RepID=UPI0033C57D06
MPDILVAGYGVMTRGILPHLLHEEGFSVSLTSRHLTTPPHPHVRLTQRADLERADIILGCFENDAASRDFWTSPHVIEMIARTKPVCIEMSTLSPSWIISWHDHISDGGGVSVECPVTGSRPGAEEGTLSAFVYESAQDERTEKTLNTFTQHRYSFGSPGHPTRFKLVYNAWGATLLHTLTAFVPTLRQTLGSDFDQAARILSSDGWMSLVCTSKLDRMIEARFDSADFALRNMVKDLQYAREVIPSPNPLLDLVHASFAEAQAMHGGDADFSAVTKTRTEGRIS